MYTLDAAKTVIKEVIMESNNVNAILMQYKDYIPNESTLSLRSSLERASDACYSNLISVPLKKPTTTLILSIFFGGLGVDRFYIGDVGLGIAKLLLGWLTCGLWTLIDIFLCYKKAKEKNLTSIMSMLN